MAESMMSFSAEIERIVELALMVLIGSTLSAHWRELLNGRVILPVLAVFFVVRPFNAVPRRFIPIPSAVTAGGPGPVTRPAHDTRAHFME
jgi:NhaP-type Na+/H+ or K+/H+ antiporter